MGRPQIQKRRTFGKRDRMSRTITNNHLIRDSKRNESTCQVSAADHYGSCRHKQRPDS